MFAKERLYLNADKTRVVGDGHKDAAFLYAAVGDEIPKSAVEKFGLVDGAPPPTKGRSRAETLLGSSLLPAMVELAAGASVQLGAVVARAHKDSGLSVDAWNDLAEADREERLAATVVVMKAEAAATKPPKAPRPHKPAKAVQAAASSKEQKPAEDKEQKGGDNKGGQQTGTDQGGALPSQQT